MLGSQIVLLHYFDSYGESMEKKEKPIYRNQSIFVWVVVLFLAYILGRSIFPLASSSYKGNSLLISVLVLLLGFIFSTILYEVGKIIFGKIAGYKLVKTNILGFTWTKQNNKAKFSFTRFTRYGGETLMSPKKDKASLVLLSLGGSIFAILINVICLVLLTIFTNNTKYDFLLYSQYIFSTIALLILIFNLAPVLNDEMYDGFVLRIYFSKKDFMKQYHQLLIQQERIISNTGKITLIEHFDLQNPLLNSVYVYNCYYYLDNNDFVQGEKIAIEGLEKGLYLTESEKAKLYNIKFYFALLRNEEEKVGNEFYKLDRSLRKQIINPHNFESLKTALLIASIIDSSYDLYEYLTLQIDKDKNKYYASRVNIEENLIDKSLSFIETKKIEWFKKEN